MCKQRAVVQKIVEHNEVNGFGVELAQAQMEDYISLSRKVTKIDKDVSAIKKEQKKQGEMLSRQGGQIDLLIKEIQCSQNDAGRYRLLVDVFKALFGTTKKTILTFIIVGVIIGLINIKDILEIIKIII